MCLRTSEPANAIGLCAGGRAGWRQRRRGGGRKLPPSAFQPKLRSPRGDRVTFFAVRRETGKEYMVQVHCSEGVAIRTGPEPCAITRKDGGEASAGGRAGQPLSRERKVIPGADAVAKAEGHTSGRAGIASARKTRRGRRTWHARTLLAREPGDLLLGHRAVSGGPHREGEEP